MRAQIEDECSKASRAERNGSLGQISFHSLGILICVFHLFPVIRPAVFHAGVLNLPRANSLVGTFSLFDCFLLTVYGLMGRSRFIDPRKKMRGDLFVPRETGKRTRECAENIQEFLAENKRETRFSRCIIRHMPNLLD